MQFLLSPTTTCCAFLSCARDGTLYYHYSVRPKMAVGLGVAPYLAISSVTLQSLPRPVADTERSDET